MKTSSFAPALFIGGCIIGGATIVAHSRPASQPHLEPQGVPTQQHAAAKTYEELATAIIAIETAEDELVKTILLGYHTAAQALLRSAGGTGVDKKATLEAAAAEISNIANEGDKAIRAVRQRLAQAGHTHNTDVETKEDYLFITNREKKELLGLAQKVAGLNDHAAIAKAAQELEALVAKSVAPE